MSALADRERLAAALGGPAAGLPGWLVRRLGSPQASQAVAAPWLAEGRNPLGGEPSGAILATGAGLALVNVRPAAADHFEVGPIPFRARAQGPAALIFGAPLAVQLAAALSSSMSGDAVAMAGAIAGAALPLADGLPAEAGFVIRGVVLPDGGFAAVETLSKPGAQPAPLGLRERLAVEALAIETVLFRHVAAVEGGIDLLDVVCFPETENKLVVLKLRPRVGGQSKTALMAALSSPSLAPEVAIAVDDDIDPFDLRDVVWSWASRVHAEVDIAQIGGLAMAAVDRSDDPQPGAKWFVDSTMPGLTQPERRDAFARAIPKNLAKVDLRDFLPD